MTTATRTLQDLRPAEAGGASCMRLALAAVGMGLRQTAGHSH